MRAFKGFNKDLTCRGYQYEEGKEFHTERAECCDIVEYLKEFHTSEGKAIKARELCVLFNVHEKQLRNIVSDLRQNGEAICSSTYGYWYSRDPDDISTTLSRLVGQVDNMQKVIAGLNRILQEVQDEQKEN